MSECDGAGCGHSSHKKVLVVGDSPEMLDVARALDRHGVEAELALAASAAVRLPEPTVMFRATAQVHAERQMDDRLAVIQPYTLPPEQKRLVEALAKRSHKPCSGTGVAGWQREGKIAVLCMCVRKKASRMEPVLKRMQADLEEKLRVAKAEGQAPESPKTLDAAAEVLAKSHTLCKGGDGTCGCTDGLSHSDVCKAEYEAATALHGTE